MAATAAYPGSAFDASDWRALRPPVSVRLVCYICGSETDCGEFADHLVLCELRWFHQLGAGGKVLPPQSPQFLPIVELDVDDPMLVGRYNEGARALSGKQTHRGSAPATATVEDHHQQEQSTDEEPDDLANTSVEIPQPPPVPATPPPPVAAPTSARVREVAETSPALPHPERLLPRDDLELSGRERKPVHVPERVEDYENFSKSLLACENCGRKFTGKSMAVHQRSCTPGHAAKPVKSGSPTHHADPGSPRTPSKNTETPRTRTSLPRSNSQSQAKAPAAADRTTDSLSATVPANASKGTYCRPAPGAAEGGRRGSNSPVETHPPLSYPPPAKAPPRHPQLPPQPQSQSQTHHHQGQGHQPHQKHPKQQLSQWMSSAQQELQQMQAKLNSDSRRVSGKPPPDTAPDVPRHHRDRDRERDVGLRSSPTYHARQHIDDFEAPLPRRSPARPLGTAVHMADSDAPIAPSRRAVSRSGGRQELGRSATNLGSSIRSRSASETPGRAKGGKKQEGVKCPHCPLVVSVAEYASHMLECKRIQQRERLAAGRAKFTSPTKGEIYEC